MSQERPVDSVRFGHQDGVQGPVFPAVWAERKTLFVTATIVAAVTLLINLALPPWYRTSAKLLPDLERNRGGGLGQAAEVAQLVGVGGPPQDPGRLYPSILTSETLLMQAVQTRYRRPGGEDSVDLLTILEAGGETPQEKLERGGHTAARSDGCSI